MKTYLKPSILLVALCLAVSCKKENNNLANTVTDIDGNVYRTVKIGTQVWMSQNLKVTHYRDGSPIQNVTESTTWMSLTAGAYCSYENSAANASVYGNLYNQFAVNDTRMIAPLGWHVATDAEWTTLSLTLGSDTISGGKLKETGIIHWTTPNTRATDSCKFTALPGGMRNYKGAFTSLGTYGHFWTSTSIWMRSMIYNNVALYRENNVANSALSVRCVKD